MNNHYIKNEKGELEQLDDAYVEAGGFDGNNETTKKAMRLESENYSLKCKIDHQKEIISHLILSLTIYSESGE